MNSQPYSGLEVAVVGMSCRMPGAQNWRLYWDNLVQAKETIHFYTDEELAALNLSTDMGKQPGFVKAEGRLDRKDCFDSAFFNYTPGEARLMNPEHRLLHECAWEAIEDAAVNTANSKNVIGLFVAGSEDLNWKAWSYLANRDGLINDMQLSYISNKDYLTSLLSYKLDLRGPSVSLHTACSSSLVAVHLACRSLLLGEMNIAIAGGITVRTEKKIGYTPEEGGILSADGHCRVFDAKASGTISSEGAGLVVLRRLKDALQDRDHIYAIIKGSAVNNDGNRKVGFTAPSVEGQADCIRAAQKFAKVTPETISYVEAHGTGTRLGDPIEIEALNKAFGYSKDHQCAIGSVKSNIGHTDSAAGVAGLIKTVLSLKNKIIPPSLHYTLPNADIDFANGPFSVNTTLRDWQRQNDAPLRAGVSSFGIGGTNAHLILEEAPAAEISQEDTGSPAIICLSAKSETALTRRIADLQSFARQAKDINLADLAFTLQAFRQPFSHRCAFTCSNREEMLNKLTTLTVRQNYRKVVPAHRPVVFLFPGQGSQYARMGAGLYDHLPIFAQLMNEGFRLLQEWTGQSYRDVLFSEESVVKKIDQTLYTQPILFLFEYALAKTFSDLGIVPDYMIGHSIGEYVAACVSGLFDWKEGLRLVHKRATLMSKLSGGAMLGAAMGEQQARLYLNDHICVAAINGPRQIVFSGEKESLEALQRKLETAGIACVPLQTSHAFHSHMLDAILDAYREELNTVTFGQLKRPWLSNLTGAVIKQEQAADPEYWVNHMRQTVRFADGIETLLNGENHPLFIELGPGSVLTKLMQGIQQHRHDEGMDGFYMVPRISKNTDDIHWFCDRLADLWAAGIPVNWYAWHQNKKRNKLSLPTYPFQLTRYPAMVDPLQYSTGKLQNISDGLPAPGAYAYFPFWKNNALPVTKQSGTYTSYLFVNPVGDFCSRLKNELEKNAPVFSVTGDWSSTGKALSGNVTVVYAATKEDNYFDLVSQFRTLRNIRKATISKIIILTSSLQSVTGTETIQYKQAPLLALANSFPQEYGIRSCVIDILPDRFDDRDLAVLTEEIQNESSGSEQLVAIRNGRRWVRDFQPVNGGELPDKKILKENGCYLITGGTGNVGMALAEYLATHYHARVVLAGRTDPDAGRSLPDGMIFMKIDVADREHFSKVVQEIEQTIGTIDGVIHAAGNTDDRHFEWVEEISEKNTRALFAPKVQGIENIYHIFRHRKCDFIWATSSLATQLGGLGFSSYAAANLYMDYFLQAKMAETGNCKCIGLSELTFTTGKHQVADNQPGLDRISLCRFFEWSLGIQRQPVILQSGEDLFARMNRAFVTTIEALEESSENGANEKNYRERISSGIYQPPATFAEKKLVDLLENFFNLTPIGINDNFFELGGDSLKATVLLKKIQKEFNSQMSLKDFFGYQTIQEIAGAIEESIWLGTRAEKKYNTII